MTLRRLLVALMVGVVLYITGLIQGCGITDWQKDQDTFNFARPILAELNSSEMNEAIQAAKEGK